ncbi:MAG TPA: LON peptidase substrate-binding domain-containing protein, partial [Candidatus Eisenbacteria bacterium]|nr:LON peptidase substrate-binding domain-containing protein [Candidatus Eisenbacteria bacterium]
MADDLEPQPVFPLPNVVLFPKTVLALHVFEPRYRLMMD